MTIYADQLRCPAANKEGRCLHPLPRGIPAEVCERRWRRALYRFLGRGLRDMERKYLNGSEPFHWFKRVVSLNQPVCLDDPVLDDGTGIEGGPMLEAWLYSGFEGGRAAAAPPPTPRSRRQAAAVARLRKKVVRGRIVAPAFAERVAPARTVQAEGVRVPDASDEVDTRPSRGRGTAVHGEQP